MNNKKLITSIIINFSILLVYVSFFDPKSGPIIIPVGFLFLFYLFVLQSLILTFRYLNIGRTKLKRLLLSLLFALNITYWLALNTLSRLDFSDFIFTSLVSLLIIWYINATLKN